MVPDEAPEEVIASLAEAVAAAGGTVVPNEPAPEADPMAMDPMAMGGALDAPPPMDMPLPGGPGAGMLPGAAMAQKGARALRPR